jgi:hypothetical protein
MVLTYSVFGWIFAESSSQWVEWGLKNQEFFSLKITETIFYLILNIIGLTIVLFSSLVLTTPSTLFNFVCGNWLQSDTKALSSILGFAFASVIIICWLDQFVRILVLISSGMLLRFDLQNAINSRLSKQIILGSLASISFMIGLIVYYQ